MDSATTALLGWALVLAERGWPVFPLKPGTKQPHGWHREAKCPRTGRCSRGHQTPEVYATTDPGVIRPGWTVPFNIGVATGPAGLTVIDCDIAKHGDPGPDGDSALADLAARRGGPLPDTHTVTTPSGGRHLYYRTPPGVRLRSTQKHLCPNVDTRSWGGHVVGPGSLTPEGGYELIDEREPAELPAWLVQAIVERPAHTSPATSSASSGRARHPGAYGTTALAGECDRIRHAAPGTHNQVLSTAAYRIGQLIGARVLDHTTAQADLHAAGQTLITGTCGCTPDEVERVITAGLDAGERNPRRITTRKAA